MPILKGRTRNRWVVGPALARLLRGALLLSIAACGGGDDPVGTMDPGSVTVSISTTGTDLDADGYTVQVGTQSQSANVNDNLTFTGVAAGNQTVTLSSIADNCAPTGPNPVTVSVPAGGSVAASFALACASNVGSISVTTMTTGIDLDDSYTVTLGGAAQTVAGNATVTFADLAVGSYAVELTAVAGNCTVGGENPLASVAVTFGATTAVTFDITCVRPAQISFYRIETDGWSEIYLAEADGSNLTNLTNNTGIADFDAGWSPDGETLAFSSDRDGGEVDIFTMKPDGSEITNITNAAGNDIRPVWSPDGSKILFVTDRDGDFELYVMNTDGSQLTNVTNNDTATDETAVWSPDGSQILFSSDRDGDFEIHIMNADGTQITQITQNNSFDAFPVFLPDASRILFVSDRDGNLELYTMNPDGTALTRLTNNTAVDFHPDISPDGTRIVFISDRDGNFEVYVMDLDGGNVTRITATTAEDEFRPRWRPGG